MLPWDCRKMEGCAQCTAMQLHLSHHNLRPCLQFQIQLILWGSQCNIAMCSEVRHFLILPYTNVTDVLSSFVTIESQKFRSGNATFCAVTHHLNKRREEGSMLAPRALNGGKVHSSKRLFNAIFGMGKVACTHHVADPPNHKTQTAGKILDVITQD